MNPALQDAILEAYALAPSNSVILHTLEIRQEGVQDPIYIARSRRGFAALDEDGNERYFEPSGFDFTLPPSSEDGFQSLNIAVDNIGRRATDFVDTAQSEEVPVLAIYRPYVSDDLSQPQMSPPLVLYLKDVKTDAFQIIGRATFMDIVNMPFPSELYNRERFPTLG